MGYIYRPGAPKAPLRLDHRPPRRHADASLGPLGWGLGLEPAGPSAGLGALPLARGAVAERGVPCRACVPCSVRTRPRSLPRSHNALGAARVVFVTVPVGKNVVHIHIETTVYRDPAGHCR